LKSEVEESLEIYTKARNLAIILGEYAKLANLNTVDFACGLSMARHLIIELRGEDLVKDADDVVENLAKELKEETGFPFPALRTPEEKKEELSREEKCKRLYNRAKGFAKFIVTLGERASLRQSEFCLGIAMLEFALSKTEKNWQLYRDTARELAVKKGEKRE